MPNAEPHAQPPVAPDIVYTWDDDTLWVGNGGAVPGGMDLSLRCIVFFGPGCIEANAFTFDEAKEILLPVLTGEVTGEVRYEGQDEDAAMTYDPESDTLRLWNGRLDGERKEIFPGCSVFLEDERGVVSSLTLERAAELLIPVLTAEPEAADDSAADGRQ